MTITWKESLDFYAHFAAIATRFQCGIKMSDTVSLSTTPTFSSEIDFRDSRLSISRTDSISGAGDDELETITNADFSKQKENEKNNTVSFASDKTGPIITTNTNAYAKLISSEQRNIEAAPQSTEEDPRTRAVEYLEKHDVLRLFQVRYFYVQCSVHYKFAFFNNRKLDKECLSCKNK